MDNNEFEYLVEERYIVLHYDSNVISKEHILKNIDLLKQLFGDVMILPIANGVKLEIKDWDEFC